ncbi:MAG TPA: carbon monoxide dehydrogenase subunit G [Burkholderiaceae bacterium]|nr:carbon monoxide dehydrogenase subunit G [Burkholderiaceae bacterium]
MELNGERTLPVSRDNAWKALNDIEALKSAVPGCESFSPAGDNAFDVAVNAAIGPVKARFKGRIELADVNAPESYTIRFDMQGGAAGFSRGEARVKLEAMDASTTRMNYAVNASIGGKIAQVGSRLVDAASATMADRFFATFAADLAAKYPPVAGAPAVPVARAPGFFATLWSFLRRLFGGQ